MKEDQLNKEALALIERLEKKGIIFYIENEFNNVVFKKDDIIYKIYFDLFVRTSGQCRFFKSEFQKGKKDKSFKYVDLNDKTFYEFQEILILQKFE